MSHVEFDAAVIDEHAQILYDEAEQIVRNWALMGALLGGILGVAISGTFTWATLAVMVYGLGMGVVVGQDRRRQMRLDAQMALLHAQVESNTRLWLSESRLAIRKLGDSVDRINRMMERQQLGVIAPPKSEASAVAPPAAPPPHGMPAPRRPVQSDNAPGAEDEAEQAMQALAAGADVEQSFYDEFQARDATVDGSEAGDSAPPQAFVPDDEDDVSRRM